MIWYASNVVVTEVASGLLIMAMESLNLTELMNSYLKSSVADPDLDINVAYKTGNQQRHDNVWKEPGSDWRRHCNWYDGAD